jgi:hypothetical protein
MIFTDGEAQGIESFQLPHVELDALPWGRTSASKGPLHRPTLPILASYWFFITRSGSRQMRRPSFAKTLKRSLLQKMRLGWLASLETQTRIVLFAVSYERRSRRNARLEQRGLGCVGRRCGWDSIAQRKRRFLKIAPAQGRRASGK